jgi:hypothetical protein
MNKYNPKLKVGDRIFIIYMDDPYTPVSFGEAGTVVKVLNVMNVTGYDINWDNGSKLSIWGDVDIWDMESNSRIKKKITESFEDFLLSNRDVVSCYQVSFFYGYLNILRQTGLVNMFGAAPYLYMGSKKIKQEIDYKDIEITEPIEKLLELADEAQSKMIQGALKRLEKQNKTIDESSVNRMIRNDSITILRIFIEHH